MLIEDQLFFSVCLMQAVFGGSRWIEVEDDMKHNK